MTPLDELIHDTLRRTPHGTRNLDEITQVVETRVRANDKPLDELIPSPGIALTRLIRRRIRALLRHAGSGQQMLPGMQDHYSTEIKNVWVERNAMSYETALWTLDRLDQRRKSAEAEYAAMSAWIHEHFPKAEEA